MWREGGGGQAAVEFTFTVRTTRNYKTVILPLIVVFAFSNVFLNLTSVAPLVGGEAAAGEAWSSSGGFPAISEPANDAAERSCHELCSALKL